MNEKTKGEKKERKKNKKEKKRKVEKEKNEYKKCVAIRLGVQRINLR